MFGMDKSTDIINSAIWFDGDAECVQCGKYIRRHAIERAKNRGKEHLTKCKDCRAKPVRSLRYNHPSLGAIECFPWSGEVDNDFNPIDDRGRLVKPGIRICGHKDCVNGNHIEKKTVSDVDLILGLVEAQEASKRLARKK